MKEVLHLESGRIIIPIVLLIYLVVSITGLVNDHWFAFFTTIFLAATIHYSTDRIIAAIKEEKLKRLISKNRHLLCRRVFPKLG